MATQLTQSPWFLKAGFVYRFQPPFVQSAVDLGADGTNAATNGENDATAPQTVPGG